MTFLSTRLEIPVATVLGWLLCAGTLHAQPPRQNTLTAPPPSKGYAEAVVQSAFGNTTSRSFGGELGVALRPGLQIFFEGGAIRDAAPASFRTSVQKITAAIAAVAGSTEVEARQPVMFGIAGVRYSVPVSNDKVEPYVMVGAGVARVKKDVTFSTPAGDSSQFVTLGSDLSGSDSRAMISLGGGIGVPLGHGFLLDLQYRYGRVFTANGDVDINRAGIGIGVRF